MGHRPMNGQRAEVKADGTDWRMLRRPDCRRGYVTDYHEMTLLHKLMLHVFVRRTLADSAADPSA